MGDRSQTSGLIRRGAWAAAVAAASNAVLFGAGKLAGVDFEVAANGTTSAVTAGSVLISSVVPVAAGAGGAAGLARVRPSALRWLPAAAVVIGIMSLGGPLTMGVGAATKVLLAAMHVTVTASFVVGLNGHARRAHASLASIPSEGHGGRVLAA